MSIQLTDSQKQAIQLALDFATSDSRILNIVGDAYTGKTTLVPYLVKELESFLKVYSSIIGEETQVRVLVSNERLMLEYLMKDIKYTYFNRVSLYPAVPVIYIVDSSNCNPVLNDEPSDYLDSPNTKFILLTRVARTNNQSFRLDPITEPVKPVRLNREDFTAKLKEDIVKETNKKYILDEATISPELGQYIENAPYVDYLYVDSILTPDDIIGLKFKNVYLHSEGSNSTPRHLQKVLGSALENLYILEG